MNLFVKNVFLVVLLFCFQTIFSQNTISGVVKTTSDESLSYSTVSLYKNEKKVYSVIADHLGNFHISIKDSGKFELRGQQAGYISKSFFVMVKGSLIRDFILEKDTNHLHWDREKKHFTGNVTSEKKSYGSMDKDVSYSEMAPPLISRMESFAYSDPIRSVGIIAPQANKGLLTAGEINDFSKWDLWKDISGQQLKQNMNYWQIHMQNRYSVQVVYENGNPVIDAVVMLQNNSETLYAAKTDNTGKAELWNTTHLVLKPDLKISLVVVFQGKKYDIKKPSTIEKSVNYLKINTPCQVPSVVDIAFVVDATGSMGSEIEFLKEDMKEVVRKSQSFSPTTEFRYANVFYRDHGDEYLTKTQNFTSVLSEAISFISEQRAGGGGDYEEAVEVALDSAINKLQWSENAISRIIFLVLDAPPHNTEEIRQQFHKLMMQAAQKGIRIVPVVASGINKNAEYLFRSLALATNGTYVFLTRHSGIGSGHIDPTIDTFKVEQLEDILERILKTYTLVSECNEIINTDILEFPDSLVNIPGGKDSTMDSTNIITHYWKYYPNPTRDFLYIQSNMHISELHITDITGKMVVALKNIAPEKTYNVDMRLFSSGIYLIRYPLNGRLVTGKFILNRSQ
jgi:hypothetical protein